MNSFKVGDPVEHVDNAPGYVGRVMLPQSSAESVTVEWPFGVQVENAHFIKLAPVRVYLAGPMRGHADFNFPCFDRSAQQLRMFGYEVFSPAEHDRKVGFDPTGMTGHEDLADYGFDLRDALAVDMDYIASKAAVVAVLAGWEESSGARAEVALAHALGLPVALWWRLPKSGEEIPDSVRIKSDHVPSGRVVKAGEQIGVSGNTGAYAATSNPLDALMARMLRMPDCQSVSKAGKRRLTKDETVVALSEIAKDLPSTPGKVWSSAEVGEELGFTEPKSLPPLWAPLRKITEELAESLDIPVDRLSPNHSSADAFKTAITPDAFIRALNDTCDTATHHTGEGRVIGRHLHFEVHPNRNPLDAPKVPSAGDLTGDDAVNHPSHYTSDKSGIECIEITRHRNFNIGNAIKYLWRAGLKQDASLTDQAKEVEDLRKAIFYITDEINTLSGDDHDG